MDFTDHTTSGKLILLRRKLTGLINLPAIRESYLIQDFREMLLLCRLLDEDFIELRKGLEKTGNTAATGQKVP